MKNLLMAATVAIWSTCAWGASFQELSGKLKAAATASCDPFACTTSVKGKIDVAAKIALSPAEQAALVPGSNLFISYQGFLMDFDLGEAPGFQAGDTSLKHSVPVAIPGANAADSIQMKWKDGVLEIKGGRNIKSAVITDPHSSPLLPEPSEKSHVPNHYISNIDIVLSDGGGDVFNIEAVVIVDVNETKKTQYNGTHSTVEKIKVRAKSTGFAPVIP